jgi:hypothetical protein
MIQNLLQHIIYNMWTHFYHFSTTVVWSRGKSPTSPSSPERSVAREQNAARQCRDWHRVTFGASNCAMDTMNVVIHMWFTNEFSLEVWLFQWWFETFEHKFPKYAEQMLGYGVCWCSNCAQFAYIKLARNPMEAFWKSISSIHQDRRLVICNTSTRSEGPEYEGPNNTHMRPQVARRRLGVFVCLCLRFLWTTMDSVMLRPCEVANSLPIPLAAAGAPRIWENLGEPALLDVEDPWGPEVLTPFADSADFTSLSGPQLSLVSNMLLLGDTKQAWSLESSISLCRFR